MEKISNKLNSKGAVSILLVMSILAVILTIVLGSSIIVSTQVKTSSGFNESMVAYYAAETGTEKAMYDRLKGGAGSGEEPAQSWRCAGTCNVGNAACCAEGWSPSGYCLNITEDSPCDYTTIRNIQSIGDYKSTRRSIEIIF